MPATVGAVLVIQAFGLVAALIFVEALKEFIESTRPARIKVSRKRSLRPP